MSYDINIQKDAEYPGQTDVESLKTFIASLPGLVANGEHGFVYGDGRELWMEIDLEFVEEDEDGVEVEDKINLVSCHIPYAFWNREKAVKYFVVCSAIAIHLKWQAIDAQTDKLIS